MHSWTERDVAGDPDGQAATDWLRRHYLRWFLERYQAWLDAHGRGRSSGRRPPGRATSRFASPPPGSVAFQAEFQELFERYHDATPETADAPDAEIVQVYLYAFPLDSRPR